MSALSIALRTLEKISPADTANAHCDIPCGIYDPHQAQIAAHTVVRMVQLITDLGDPTDTEARNKLVRYIAVKEEHAELAKKELANPVGRLFPPGAPGAVSEPAWAVLHSNEAGIGGSSEREHG